ncbi:MAG: hypothetical protein AAB373_01065 [Patescibacteria group bacterium]
MAEYTLKHGESSRELWAGVSKLRDAKAEASLLSAPELADLRIAVAHRAMSVAECNISTFSADFNGGMQLSSLINNTDDLGVWRERITTSTHFVRGEDGYRFYHGLHINPATEQITDGGFSYKNKLDSKGVIPGELIPVEEYVRFPGGCYEVRDFLNHRVFRALLGDDDSRIKQYGDILTVLSHGRLASPGRESIWCPQELPVDYGRAWALGMQADSAYPPNNTTRNHWGIVKSKWCARQESNL